MRWLYVSLHAPMGSFGGAAVDARGITRDFPAQSMLTGLFANALGWTRAMASEHERLQHRICFAALWRATGASVRRMTDYQTARLNHRDKAWTTLGAPATRSGGPATYLGSYQRYRDYHADLEMSVVMRLTPEKEAPTLDDLGEALKRPARPLFIGRKSCLPSRPLLGGYVDAPDISAATRAIVPRERGRYRVFWSPSELGATDFGLVRTTYVTDERDWRSGLHGGARKLCEGVLEVHGGEE